MLTPPNNAIAIGRRSFPGCGEPLTVRSPIDGEVLAAFPSASPADLQPVITAACDAFKKWRLVQIGRAHV